MADLIDRAALSKLFEERFLYLKGASEQPLSGGRVLVDREIQTGAIIAKEFLDHVRKAPAVDAVEVEALRRQLLKAGTLLYGGDENFEKRMGGYNPSSFVAGFSYALERMMVWAKSLETERRTDATD